MEGEYPLHHLLVKTRIEEMNQTVKDCKKSLQMMSIVGVKDKLNKINDFLLNHLNLIYSK